MYACACMCEFLCTCVQRGKKHYRSNGVINIHASNLPVLPKLPHWPCLPLRLHCLPATTGLAAGGLCPAAPVVVVRYFKGKLSALLGEMMFACLLGHGGAAMLVL